MDTNKYNREKYAKSFIPLRTDEDRDACLRHLTNDSFHMQVCRNTYNDKDLKNIIEEASHYLEYTMNDDNKKKQIVGFALLKIRKDILEIRLLCAIPNKDNIGTMIAFGAYNIGIMKNCKRIFIAPRTEKLREIFIRHGYTKFFGTRNVDEVLEKPIIVPKYTKINKTLKKRKIHSKKENTRKLTKNTDSTH